MNTTVLTYIYSPNNETRVMVESASRFFPVINAGEGKHYKGNGIVIRELRNALTELKEDLVIYSDGGDTIFLDTFTPLSSMLVYSVEKACWPLPQISPLFEQRGTPWKYLNGGNWCGPRELMIEFYDKYVIPYLFRDDVDGQSQQSVGYLKAIQDGFPIRLDYSCRFFQSMAFEDPGDFSYTDTRVKNMWTDSTPAVLHYNGRTNMTRGIQLYHNQILNSNTE